MEIYKVSVCKFIDSENHCYVERLIVDNYYDHYNRILASEAPKINFTDYFGVSVDKVKLDALPGSEQLKLKNAYLKHKLTKGKKSKQKVIKDRI